MTTQWEYEFDPYGDNPNNLIVDEPHTITPANGKNFSFFIPKKGPFHRRSVIVKDRKSGARLNIGTDWYVGWRYDDIILSGSVQPVYGAIVLNDPTKSYDVLVTYRTVGGPTVLDDQEIVKLLANTQRDPRRALWTDVVGVPDELPPIPHRQSTGDLIGFDSMVEVLYKIADSISEGNVKSMQALMEHVADHHNPHRITLSDLGIDELGNLIAATKEEAEGGTDNTHYMTSLRVAQYSAAKIIPVIDAHKNDKGNPHGTTKAQVGLGLVENYQVASSVEAEAGVATNRYMTPATTAILMQKNFVPLLDAHISDKQNPHGTTKAQVGLGSVDNFATATSAEAGAVTATNRFMTPYGVGLAIASYAPTVMEYHTTDYDNPHKVTKNHVGLGNVQNFGIATVQEALAGTATDKYITPYLLSQVIAIGGGGGGGGDLGAHIADHDNPHMVNKNQVGLGSVENYASATAVEMKTLTGDPRYVTTTSLKGWFDADGGASQFINAAFIGLDRVKNYGIATDNDIRAVSNTAYATPATVEKMIGDSLIKTPMLTNEVIDPATYTGVPYAAVEVSSSFGVDPRKNGFSVSYALGETTGQTTAYLLTDFDLTGARTYTGTLNNIKPTFQNGVAFASFTDSSGTEYTLGIVLTANMVYLANLAGGQVDLLDAGIATTGLTNTAVFAITVNATTKSYSVVVTIGSTNYTVSGNAGTLQTLLGLDPADVADTSMSGAYGFVVELDETAATTNSTRYSSTYLPNSTDTFVYNVNSRTKWSYDGTKWVVGEILEPGDTATIVTFKPGSTYWNPMTDELFLAVTPRHTVAYGMGTVVDV